MNAFLLHNSVGRRPTRFADYGVKTDCSLEARGETGSQNFFGLEPPGIGTGMDAGNDISLPGLRLAEIQSAAEAEHRSVDEVLTVITGRAWIRDLESGSRMHHAPTGRMQLLSIRLKNQGKVPAEIRGHILRSFRGEYPDPCRDYEV
jgi:hypothetical protein